MKASKLFNLSGKTAIVTGGARGLGKELALTLAENGASVSVTDIVSPEDTARAIKDNGVRSLSLRMDVSNETEVKDSVNQVISEFGKVDILINNAGVSQVTNVPTEDLSVEEWDKVIQTNLRGTFICSKHVGGAMINSGGGTIINIATTAGITGISGAPAYSASKAGVILLTKCLALEWSKYSIRVNAIAPHYLDSDMTLNVREAPDNYRKIIKKIPMKRFGKLSDVAGCVLMLAAAEASSYITGAVIPIDGGFLAN
jgi:NAD(P)-dependent dehydrogenase (short-subunit alcohol dehydrogenase family)